MAFHSLPIPMKAPLFALLLAAVAPMCTAQETFKCKVNGSFVYQDRPCPGAARYSDAMPGKVAKTESAPPVVSQSDKAAPLSDLEKQKAFIAKGAKDRKISDLKYQIENTEASISNSHAAMQYELAALDARRGGANNNLAGATYLQSLATEKNAVTSRYESEISTQRERLKNLREDLAKAQKVD